MAYSNIYTGFLFETLFLLCFYTFLKLVLKSFLYHYYRGVNRQVSRGVCLNPTWIRFLACEAASLRGGSFAASPEWTSKAACEVASLRGGSLGKPACEVASLRGSSFAASPEWTRKAACEVASLSGSRNLRGFFLA